MLAELGEHIYRRRWWTLILAGLFLIVSVAMLLRGGVLTSGTFRGIESDRAQKLVEEVLGHPDETTFLVIFRAHDLSPTSPAFRSAVEQTLGPLRHDPRLLTVVSPADAPHEQAVGMINESAHASLAIVTLAGDVKQALRTYPQVRAELHSTALEVTCAGFIPFTNDLNQTLEHDLARADLISVPLALFILLAVFGTLVAASLPVGVGGLAVAGGIAIVLQLSRRIDIAQYTINVCSLIGLGVAIDYSLFIASRYREELAAGKSYPDALSRALATAGRVVAFSGVAVGTGLAGLLFFEGSYLSAMGLGGAIVVALAVLFALTFLPALLAVLGPRIHAGRVSMPHPQITRGLWHRMATWVMRRPVAVLLPTLGILLAMGSPFFHLRMASADVRVLDTTVEARRGYEDLRADFPEYAMTRMVVAVRFPSAPVLRQKRIGQLYDLSRSLARIPNVRKVESIVDLDASIGKPTYELFLMHPSAEDEQFVDAAKRRFVGDRVTIMYVLTDAMPESEVARNIVQSIRAQRQVGDGTLLVGGQTAQDIDATAFILERAPRAVGFIVCVTLVILFLLFGSVVLPIKAVVMNIVSIAGAFGAVVWIFQDGHLFIHQPLPLDPALPVLLFCVLFGLSMDYEVLMLSRIKESYDRTGDNARAVAEGLEKTAGLITSAALIMVSVFSAFALARVVLLQAVGFGMALAVALDATLVRVLLVPATMRLFGHLNWWAPSPLLKLRRVLALRLKRGRA